MPNKFFFFKSLLVIALLTNPITGLGQKNTLSKDKIKSIFENYFKLDREILHVHFNKTLYFSNESIWFKGYAYNGKTNLPFFLTTNIYLSVINEDGVKVEEQLLYGSAGTFSGSIKLNKKYSSGFYYLQFYTNWMNNFKEDESSVYRIQICNENDTSYPLKTPTNYSEIKVSFHPEGGKLVSNLLNNVGIKITDKNGETLPEPITVDIKNDAGEVIKSTLTNKHGVGRFEFIPTEKNYSAFFTINGVQRSAVLPQSEAVGLALQVNNYILEDKTLFKIHYNELFLSALDGKSLYFVIQQNEKINLLDLVLDKNSSEKEIILSNDYLFSGCNTIRIIDSNENEIAQRILFKNTIKNSTIQVTKGTKTKELIEFSGKSDFKEASISATFLPLETQIESPQNIYCDLLVNPYLNDKINLSADYFINPSRNKKYELDLLLLTQKTNKYEWNLIKSDLPKDNYEFEIGVTVKGVINQTSADVKKSKVVLKNILQEELGNSEINDKNEFILNNIIVTDSASVFFELVDKKSLQKKEMKYHISVLNDYKKYNKIFVPKKFSFDSINPISTPENTNEIPLFDKNSTLLEEVKLKREKKKLKRQNLAGHSFLNGFKVEDHPFKNGFVLDFIEQNGFTVLRNNFPIVIRGRSFNSINASSYTTPLVYLDGVLLVNLDQLLNMRLDALDEIYISSTAIVASMNNNQGMIKMYSKIPKIGDIDSKKEAYILSGGFQPMIPFVNVNYITENNKGFQNYGLIHWNSRILSNEIGIFKFDLPWENHKTSKVIFEGMTPDGEIFIAEKELNLE